MNVLATIAKPSSGRVVFNNLELSSSANRKLARRQIGYLPQRFSISNRMSVLRHVEYAAWVNGVSDNKVPEAANTALSIVQLNDLSSSKAGKLSGGQRQRLGIACAIAHNPSLLLLDEPTVGLDPSQRIDVRSYLNDYGESAIVLLSTHLVEDISVIANEIVILSEGRICFRGTVSELEKFGKSDSIAGSLESGYLNVIKNNSTYG